VDDSRELVDRLRSSSRQRVVSSSPLSIVESCWTLCNSDIADVNHIYNLLCYLLELLVCFIVAIFTYIGKTLNYCVQFIFEVRHLGLSLWTCLHSLRLNCNNSILKTVKDAVSTHALDWIVQCFTSPPTQYRLYGRRFLQVKRPNQQYQSTEGNYQLMH